MRQKYSFDLHKKTSCFNFLFSSKTLRCSSRRARVKSSWSPPITGLCKKSKAPLWIAVTAKSALTTSLIKIILISGAHSLISSIKARLPWSLGGDVKNAVEVGGDQPQRAITIARQTQQRGMRVGSALAAQLGFQRVSQRAPYCKALARQAPL